MDHDGLFKELLHEFLADFICLFFPEIADRLDLSVIEFAEQEVFTDFPQGERRNTDALALVRSREGTPEALYIHIEVESARRRTFSRRFWEYYSLLRIRRQLPVIPIVIYLAPGAGGIVMESYREENFGQTYLTFQYHAVGLPDLNSEEYQNRAEPLSVALSALMKPGVTTALERRWSAILSVARHTGINDAQKALLSTVIESYIKLEEAEAAEFNRRVTETREVQMFVTIYEQRGIERGIQQGIERGIEQGKRDSLLRLGSKRLGEPDTTISEAIASADATRLDTALEGLLEAESWQDLYSLLIPASPSGN